MKNYLFLFFWLVMSCFYLTAFPAYSQGNQYSHTDYEKSQARIEMRDGIRLHTVIYAPKDTTRQYPVLLKRTPYSCRPYEEGRIPEKIVNNPWLQQEGFIFVCQDVRGRWMSEGSYTTMTPNETDPNLIDESSDTYETIEWLLNNLPNHNGKVGQWGISYPGFYTSAALPDAHPALAASSPQAPIADFFFDDFHHHGAYTIGYWYVTPLFGIQHDGPADSSWYSFPDAGTNDGYYFYKNLLPLSTAEANFGEDNFFWKELVNHPNYDEFWQRRNILPHLRGISHPVMTVGGWFDAEDLYGPLQTYKTIEENNPDSENILVMGPWSHGQWDNESLHQSVGNIYFGEGISRFYQKEIEYPFFMKYLKEEEAVDLPEATVFDTGKKEWKTFSSWPPENSRTETWYLRDGGIFKPEVPKRSDQEFSEYISDIENPVPYREENDLVFIPRDYMTGDQRFAARRPDVLTFETGRLQEDVTLVGGVISNLYVSTSGTASDWIVKIVDIFPADTPEGEYTPEHVELDNYHMMVRSEAIRGRFRNSYEFPEPFTPNEVTKIELPLQDLFHTFKKGHKIQIQIQSTWFPFIDLNPQTYVPNIFKAVPEDFKSAVQWVYHSTDYPSSLELILLEP